MRRSRHFLPSLRGTPKEAEVVPHQPVAGAGMLGPEATGIYALLPLGSRMLEKIVRNEKDRAGALELIMPTLQFAS